MKGSVKVSFFLINSLVSSHQVNAAFELYTFCQIRLFDFFGPFCLLVSGTARGSFSLSHKTNDSE
jgi:hypothetical protein